MSALWGGLAGMDRQNTMTDFDRVLDGFPPYFPYADMTWYITRGRKPAAEEPPLSMEEWLAYIPTDSGLALDEVYEQSNPNSEVSETWREIGRARWLEEPEPDWFHFSRARIEYIHGRQYKGGPAAGKAGEIWKELGPDPTLEQWAAYIEQDRSLTLVTTHAILDAKASFSEPGLGVWRKGGAEHLFRYIPSSVWLYIAPVSSFRAGDPAPDNQRERKCHEIATALSAQVWPGRRGA